MADFPYTQVTGKLKNFFCKIVGIGVPKVVNKKWLSSIGFNASNDSTIIPVIRFVDFIDQSNAPTESWQKYRVENQARKVLAEGIRKGYDSLFQTYPDAYSRSDDQLKSFFKSKTLAGDQVITKTISTFKNLCELADFESIPEKASDEIPVSKAHGIKITDNKELGTGVTININIQLTLPDTTDESVYDKLFISMKKHLIS